MSVLIAKVLQPSDNFRGYPLDSLQQRRESVLCWELQNGMQYSTWGLIRAEKRENIIILVLLPTLLMQPRIWFVFWAASAHYQLRHNFPPIITPKSFSTGMLSIPSSPCLYWYQELTWTSVDLCTWHIEPHEFLMGPLLELVQFQLGGIPSLGCVNHATQLDVICKFPKGALYPAMSVMKILYNTGPGMDPSGTPLISDFQLDIEPLTTALWLWPPKQFCTEQSTHRIHISSIYREMWGTMWMAIYRGEQIGNFSCRFLRTLGCILSGPTDSCIFKFLRSCWTWTSMTGRNLFSQSFSDFLYVRTERSCTDFVKSEFALLKFRVLIFLSPGPYP